MTYYKQVIDGYIPLIGTGDDDVGEDFTEITETEYNEILQILDNRHEETLTTKYRLKDDLTWESYSVEPPELPEEADEVELLNILLGGAE